MSEEFDFAKQKLEEALAQLKEHKPNDRTEKDRYTAICITDLERVIAFYEKYVAPKHDTNQSKNARMLRIAVVRNVLGQDMISRDDALDLLRGPLTPGDLSTAYDDSGLIDAALEEATAKILGR
jgi:hypothetical protein